MKQTFGSHLDGFIANSIAQGNYKDANEVLRAGLRLLEEEENRRQALKEAIREGDRSGEPVELDMYSFLDSMKASIGRNGEV
jgi:antitoxin ParD1/3/4